MSGGRPRRVRSALRRFLSTEASGGLALLVAAAAAMVWANLFQQSYTDVWGVEFRIGAGPVGKTLDLRHWINDALMVIFFLVVGLEIKRELVVGELRERRAAMVPIAGAVGGMVGPALVYLAFNPSPPDSNGWGVPMATDIAFALGVLSLAGKRVPSGMKLFLLTLAIVDDIGAIAVIALFYTDDLALLGIAVAAGGAVVVLALRRVGVWTAWGYALPGLVVWSGVAASGVHPTIAGVALGLMTPAGTFRGRNVLQELQDRLHPVSSFLVVPLFALANAGVAVDARSLGDAVRSPIFGGVTSGLVLGKTIGISLATWAIVRFARARLPSGMRMGHVVAVGALGGIGFTVAIFIGELAFDDAPAVAAAKTGILVASVASALIGTAAILLTHSRRRRGRN